MGLRNACDAAGNVNSAAPGLASPALTPAQALSPKVRGMHSRDDRLCAGRAHDRFVKPTNSNSVRWIAFFADPD